MVLNLDCVIFMNLQRENVEKTTDTVSLNTRPVSQHHGPHLPSPLMVLKIKIFCIFLVCPTYSTQITG